MDNRSVSSAVAGFFGGAVGAFAANQIGVWKKDSKLQNKYQKCQEIRKLLTDNTDRDTTLEKMGCSDRQLLQLLENDN